jgi:aspartyl aminopeptidase
VSLYFSESASLLLRAPDLATMITEKKIDSATLTKDFLDFIDASPTPFHAVASVVSILRKAGFVRISEADKWDGVILWGGRYYFTRGGATLVAFVVPDLSVVDRMRFEVIGAHTDSPCFKVKPVSNVIPSQGYLQVGVECYGGGLWHTWFDRDLGIAGRVITRKPGTAELNTRLVHINKPLMRIPNLAIHLMRTVTSEGFKVDLEKHTVPVLGLQVVEQQLNGPAEDGAENVKAAKTLAENRHPPALLAVLATELGVCPEDIVDLDLCLMDTQPAAIGGVNDEFIFAPRLDNLASCYTACHALVRSLDEQADHEVDEKAIDGAVRMIAFFDHEEVGSTSAHGADSPVITDTLKRISDAIGDDIDIRQLRAFLMSADMAHAVHPNYPEKHEAMHRPKLGSGPVIKTNQNQRYATTGVTAFIVREIARRAGGIPVQEFVVPNGIPCGSTIGPALSSRTGIRTVDIGQPQLSMHSIREMCHAGDLASTEKLFHAFFMHFGSIDQAIASSEIE